MLYVMIVSLLESFDFVGLLLVVVLGSLWVFLVRRLIIVVASTREINWPVLKPVFEIHQDKTQIIRLDYSEVLSIVTEADRARRIKFCFGEVTLVTEKDSYLVPNVADIKAVHAQFEKRYTSLAKRGVIFK